MTSGQDGRLDLDELGSVIDDAAVLGDEAETLADDHGTPSVGQRLAATGLGAWAARHRGAVRAGDVVAAVGAVALLVRTATAPPPPSPDVVATLAPDLAATGAGVQFDPGGGAVVTSALLLSGVRPGESVRLTGISGPGLRASTATTTGPASDGVERWSVSAVLGCEGTGTAGTAGTADVPADVPADRTGYTGSTGFTGFTRYTVGLARTDAWGRVATSTVDLPPGGPDWSAVVAQVCWADQAAAGVTISGLTARADTQRGLVTVGFDVLSTLPVAAFVGVLPDTTRTLEVGQSFRAPLLPGRVTQVDATLRVTSCADVAPPSLLADPSISGGRPVPGIPLVVQAARDDRAATVPFLLDERQTGLVQDALDLVCAQAPRVVATVAGVGPGRTGAVGEAAAASFSLRFRLTSSAEGRASVTLAWDGYGYATSPQSSSTVVELGPRATTVELSWLVACLTTPPPPTLRVVVQDGDRTGPWARVMDDAALEDALVAGCDGLTREMLVTSGWPVRPT